MIAGDLKPAELPGAWAEGCGQLLGVVPQNDREGCLQDIHWYDGNWGYFPTYTLGALIAAQLFEVGEGDIPDLMQAIAAGEFAPLLGWLRSGCIRRDRCCRRRSWLKVPRAGRSEQRASSDICAIVT